MTTTKTYLDLDGDRIDLSALDAEEQQLIARLRRRAARQPDFWDFDTYWMATVAAFYDARGLSRQKSRHTAAYHIGQDLRDRLGLACGLIRPNDYRDELEELIRTQYPSRRAFCQATGLSEDMLSHVLAGRKDLSLAALEQALARIGHRLRIVPGPEQKRTG
jgi:hypothetical protein